MNSPDWFAEVPEPWRSRYQRACPARSESAPMLGGEFGGRFFTNGHWMMLVPEDVWQAAVASGWRDVRARWSDYARLFDGCGIEANVLAFAVVEERNGVRLAKVGSVWMRAEHHELLVEFEVVDVVIKDDDVPMLLAPGLAIVSCMARNSVR